MDIKDYLNQEGHSWEDLVYYILGNSTRRTLREMESGDIPPLNPDEVIELERYLLDKTEELLFGEEQCDSNEG